ncbi:hypothetical protein [Maritalea sp.]|jgi:hypothetical protein|uniref:hypothetical protein n=1 Tax=Maritalea sp. TaxID=2003361 RepID=UPI0039E6DD42
MIVYFCIEDELSRTVAERLICDCCPAGTYSKELGKAYGGFGYIKSNLQKFHNLALTYPVLIITDMDQHQCPPSLRRNWLAAANLDEPLPNSMLFCIAQTEIESWLLADTRGIAQFLSISQARLQQNIELTVIDSKEYLINLARRSRNAAVRKEICPERGSSAITGMGYNYKLSQFVRNDWDVERAAENSSSLRRTINKLAGLAL